MLLNRPRIQLEKVVDRVRKDLRPLKIEFNPYTGVTHPQNVLQCLIRIHVRPSDGISSHRRFSAPTSAAVEMPGRGREDAGATP